MYNFSKLFVLAFLSIIFVNCGGNSPSSNSMAVNTNSSISETQTNSVSTSNVEQAEPAFNSLSKKVGDGYPAPANANVTVVNTSKVTEEMKEQPAPDDSTFSAEMNAKGQPVETRTFKSHPVLAKVEKITMSPRDYVFKIYLRNGKVVESKSDELKDFRVIAPVNILDAIGMKPPPPKPDPNAPRKIDKDKPVLIPKANQLN